MLTRHYIKPYQLLAIIGVVNYVIMYTIGWVMAGTIISGILLLLVAVPLIYQYCNKQQLGIMRVSLSTYDTHPQSYSKTAELEISDTQLLVYVSPKKGTSWDRVNIRFVERKFCPRLNGIWKYEDADPNIVSITDFRDVIQEKSASVPIPNRYFESDVDSVGRI